MAAPWAESTEQVLKSYKTDLSKGLTDAQVTKLRAEYGTNELDKEEGTPLWKLVLQQFDDLLVKILLGAALLSFVLAFFEGDGDEGLQAFVEPFVIMLILVINAVVGVWQEHNAENALDALKEMQTTTTKVLRNGVLVPDVPSSELVPGDVVDVRVGDKVPADVRIIKLKTTTIKTDEGSLTGESETVLKQLELVEKDVRIQGKLNMMFSGTTISNGAAIGVVTATGMRTEIGKIQANVTEAKEDEEKTPLGQKIDAFGEQLARVIAAICVLVWIMNINQFSDPVHGGFWKGMIYYLKIAVALGVAAIPEGLPAVITLCLALGTRKMVKRNAVIRKLPSVETLGCCTVICSDKTGTLTTNQMTVVAMAYPGKAAGKLTEHEVEGTSYDPKGEVKGLPSPQPQGVLDLAKVCSLCNESVIRFQDGKYERMGEPTEAALKVLVEKIGLTEQARSSDPALACTQANAQWAAQNPQQAILEFNRDRKSMSTLCGYSSGEAPPSATGTPGRTTRSGVKTAAAGGSGKNQIYCKGAPESVLERCAYSRLADGSTVPMSAADRKAILAKVSEMAARPLRTLAMAIKEDVGDLADYDGPSHPSHKKLTDVNKFEAIEKDMVFVGLCGIKDPARPEVKPAIESCATAGIRVVMITGDTKPTAEAIAREIGIFGPKESIDGRSFTGAEFFDLPPAKRIELLTTHRTSMVFSRTEPRDKQELVKILRQAGEVPAMTGDGVNDAPALKKANIGVAMGSGTAVAKTAADMVLADDNFSTIVAAVEEGRAIFNNTKAFIRYLISSNIGEVAAIFITALLGLPEGLIPLQLLWVNLVTDGLPATALSFNPPDIDVMRQPPRPLSASFIDAWLFTRYMLVGLYVGVATVAGFALWFMRFEEGPQLSYYQLTHWHACAEWGDGMHAAAPAVADCGVFMDLRPKTVALSVLVTIEMFNALNALSENESLLRFPPWKNVWLLGAIVLSFAQHFLILYVSWFNGVFGVAPLSWAEWKLVLAVSAPVILLDEVLKLVTRMRGVDAMNGVVGASPLPSIVARASAMPQEEKAE